MNHVKFEKGDVPYLLLHRHMTDEEIGKFVLCWWERRSYGIVLKGMAGDQSADWNDAIIAFPDGTYGIVPDSEMKIMTAKGVF